LSHYPVLAQLPPGITTPPFVVDNIVATEIRKSPIHGYGLFAQRRIARGSLLCTLDGQVVSWASFERMCAAHPFEHYDPYLLLEWNALEEDVLLVRPFRTKYSWINHSRSPNVVLRKYPVSLIALRAIESGEELRERRRTDGGLPDGAPEKRVPGERDLSLIWRLVPERPHRLAFRTSGGAEKT
jgi:hypothetical protein